MQKFGKGEFAKPEDFADQWEQIQLEGLEVPRAWVMATSGLCSS